MKAQVTCYCPPMQIDRISMKLRRTHAEPMVGQVIFEDSRILNFPNVLIPETDVRCVRFPLHWQVDACIGEGSDGANSLLTVWLPAEPVHVHPFKGYSVAVAIEARTRLILADGSKWEGSVTFPDCKADLQTGVAEAVTARGMVEKVTA